MLSNIIGTFKFYDFVATLPQEVKRRQKACYFQLTTTTDRLNLAVKMGCREDIVFSGTVSDIDRDGSLHVLCALLFRPCPLPFTILSRQFHLCTTARLQ